MFVEIWRFCCVHLFGENATRNFSMALAADPTSIKEVLAFTMMPSAMPVRLTALA